MRHAKDHLYGSAADLKGKEGELIAYELAQVSFLKDWCFQNPKLEDGKELCDLLIIFDDNLFIWQIKNVKLEDGQYKEKHKTKNTNQLIGAHKQIFKLNKKVVLPNYGELDPSLFKHVFLCSVFMGEPEIGYSFIEKANGYLIHIIHKDSLHKIVNELDTVSDFIRYYKTKEAIHSNSINLIVMGGEEELLAYYVKNNREIPLEQNNITLIDDGIWSNLKNLPQYNARNDANKFAAIWDEQIQHLLEEFKSQSIYHKPLLIEFLRPTRFYRRVLSKVFIDLILKAARTKVATINRYLYTEETDNTAYCFVYGDAEQGYTAEKIEVVLEMCGWISKYLYPNARVVIGIACIKCGDLFQYLYTLYDGPGLTQEEYDYYITSLGRTLQKTEYNESEYLDF